MLLQAVGFLGGAKEYVATCGGVAPPHAAEKGPGKKKNKSRYGPRTWRLVGKSSAGTLASARVLNWICANGLSTRLRRPLNENSFVFGFKG